MSPGVVRRWGELARELEFCQLDMLRKQAEGWRNGLLGLTALVTVVTVLKGRDDLSQLPSSWRIVATSLLGVAFLLLVVGSLLAVRASFGRPGEQLLLGGNSLRRWTRVETTRVRRALHLSAAAFAGGVLLVVAALGVSWTYTESPATNLVKVTTVGGTVCGELVSYVPARATLLRTSQGSDHQMVIPGSQIRRMTPASAC
ncbi:hypothetical protein ACFQ6S_00460 [Streptomyces sp. NPDC056479]|uniref:hypothetical protein n=1 Tax=Streptomyces sp. NPDC056479 TaxID=3345832 RepID=UPI0036A15718